MYRTILSAGLAAVVSASGALAQEYSLRLGHIFAESHPIGLGAQAMADYVAENSDGRMKIVIYPSSQLGGLRALEDAASEGLLDITQSAAPTLQAIYPTAIILTLPYAFRDEEHLATTWGGDIGEEIRQGMIDDVDLRVLSALPQPGRNISSNTPIANVDDLQGLQIRVPQVPSWVAFFEATGAVPTPIDLGELVTSLQLGIVTAEENPWATMESMKLADVQDYLVPTSHVLTMDFFLVNEGVYQGLPEDLRTVLMEGGAVAEQMVASAWAETSEQALEALQTAGMELVEVDIDSIAAVTEGLYDDLMTPEAKALYDRMQAE